MEVWKSPIQVPTVSIRLALKALMPRASKVSLITSPTAAMTSALILKVQ